MLGHLNLNELYFGALVFVKLTERRGECNQYVHYDNSYKPTKDMVIIVKNKILISYLLVDTLSCQCVRLLYQINAV